MPNLLKSVFSKDEVRYQGTIHFENPEARKQFEEALETVYKEGKTVAVEGVDSVTTKAASGDISYPLDTHDHICKLIVGPSVERVPIEVETDGIRKDVTLIQKRLRESIVLETEPEAVISLSFSFPRDGVHNASITFAKHFERAKTVKDVSEGLKNSAALLLKFFEKGQGSTNDGTILTLSDVVNHFKTLGNLCDRLSSIEERLSIHLSPEALISISKEDVSIINDLFILVCEEKALRTNMKLTSTDSARIVINEEPILGRELFIRFTGTIEYDLFGEAIKLFSVCAAVNAVVKEIIPAEDTVRVLYGDSDSKPMYISMKAFKTEEEARQEASQITSHKMDYINAKTAWEYLKGTN